MASKRSALGALFELAAAGDLDGVQDESKVLDLTGSAGCVIVAQNDGSDGTAGQDVIVFSRDGGITYKLATAANIGQGHAGLKNLNTGAAATGAALNGTAGTEVDEVFGLGPVDGPFQIKLMRDTSAGFGTDWVTGAPSVEAVRIG